MATNYPYGQNDGLDTFAVTTDPSNTPLSQSGQGGTRNHVESHTDMGDAITALEINAALKTHDHSGDAGDRARGAKLSWANTHQTASASGTLNAAQALADTDDSNYSIHHTLGTGQYQAAAGNHAHDYTAILNTPWRTSTSGNRPSGLADGTMLYETDTGCVRMLRGGVWVLTTIGKYPIIRLRQSANQNLSSGGTTLQWGTESEDNMSWVSVPVTSVTLQEGGLYRFDAAIQWNPNYVPENATAVIMVNSSESDIKVTKYQKQGLGVLAPAGFVQTLSLSGLVRVSANSQVGLKCSYTAPGSILAFIASFFDSPSQTKSRLDITYVSA